jgi:hypothetical protein
MRMRNVCLFVTLGVGLAMQDTGCTSQPQTVASPPQASPNHAKQTDRICDAVESARALLRGHGLDWGEPKQILRTVSNWYRIEYGKDSYGSERVILVNPESGQAEFPLRR